MKCSHERGTLSAWYCLGLRMGCLEWLEGENQKCEKLDFLASLEYIETNLDILTEQFRCHRLASGLANMIH